MNLVLNLILAVQLLSAVAMIGLILIQHGKGADMGAAFGSGSSGSLFGASGSANFLSRTTAVLAALFFVCTLLLAYFGAPRPAGGGMGSVLDNAVTAPAPAGAASSAAPGASQVPGASSQVPGASSQVPGASPSVAPAAPAAATSGAAQVPAK